MHRFVRDGDELVLTLRPNEADVLRDVARQVAEVVESGPTPGGPAGGDPVRDRLFPRAYLDPTEDAAEGEWRAAVHDDLVRSRAEALGALVATIDDGTTRRRRIQVRLGPEDAERWLGALNDVRLVLGVAIGVTEESEERQDGGLAADDPRRPTLELYRWLTFLQDDLVGELLGTGDLPDWDAPA